MIRERASLMARVFGTVARAIMVVLAPGLLCHPAGATTLYGVPVTGNFLVEFESTAPQTIASVVPISGLQPPVTLQLDDGSSYTRTVTYEIVTVIGGP
jgi:hypothetical protein